MHEQRKTPRQRTFLQAEITTVTGMVLSCGVKDLSEAGARLSVGDPVWIPDQFTLHVFGREWVALAEVRWRKGYQVGVQFRSLRLLRQPASQLERSVA